MPDLEVKSYDDIIKHLKGRKKHLLLGNGFSMSYNKDIFSYNALSKFINGIKNKELQQLFEIVNTNNFELLTQQLDNAARIAKIFGADKKIVQKIKGASETLKTSLIEAIKELHPEHVFTIHDSKIKSCSKFLSTFLNNDGQIFTTNYDLLLYWVLMRGKLEKLEMGLEEKQKIWMNGLNQRKDNIQNCAGERILTRRWFIIYMELYLYSILE